ncbi:MAG: hypothetical protein ACRDGQ_13675, partial [Candidatus Limnocylindrales bacterium]
HDFDGTWKFVNLTAQPGTTAWTGATQASQEFTSSDALDYFVQAVDGAGNVSTASNKATGFAARITDVTPPTISAAISAGNLGPNGWYSSAVVVHFTCADSGSGIPGGTCPADQDLASDGAAVSSSPETVADAAGNVSAPSNVITVKIDRPPPVITAGGPYAGTVGSPVVLSGASAADALNQASTTVAWTIDSPACQFSSAAIVQPTLTCTSAGTVQATLNATDGTNASPPSLATVEIAKRADTLSATCLPSLVLPGTTSTCTAVVNDPTPIAGFAPSGGVTWAVASGAGSFGPSSCTSADATLSCSAIYTVGASQAQAQSITASYAGDSSYLPSAVSSGLNVLVANADRYATPIGTRLVVSGPGVLANDLPGGLVAILGSPPTTGTLVLATNGGLTYTPRA